ncbi:MAG: enoyl-[acyl-carrier-protein] reductase FabK [Clostridiales bacterium]|nr:enoyl-[acyl-carrier-protein] reductase FabK [Clostridiales bacterium]
MKTICDVIKTKYPIIQGGMAWIADGDLAAAVSEAGGLGVIAAGAAPGEYVRAEIRKAKAKTKNPFAVNVMLLSPEADDVVKVVIDEGVGFVTTGAGNPQKYMESLKKAGVVVIPVVASVAHAKKMQKYGASAVVAEGMEAGGHIGKLTTMAMTPQIVDAVSIPVAAAGGIADGRGLAAAFALGARGAQIGTRFLVAKECNVHQNYKNMVLKAKDIDTVVTGQITGHPVRGVRNYLTRAFEAAEKEESRKDKPDIKRLEEMGVGRLRLAAVEGDADGGSVFAGQIAGLINKEETCVEIIEGIMDQFKDIIKNIFI